MKKRLHHVIKHPLIAGSIVFFVGSGLANIFNYLFNLSMGRLLSAPDYGSLAALIAIINIFHVFSSSITTVFTKFTALFVGQKQENHLWILLKKGTVWIGLGSLLAVGLILLVDDSISHFLKIGEVTLIDIIGIAIFLVLITSVPYGILQGQLRFTFYSFMMLLSSVLKFFLGLILVLSGFNILGAVLGIFIASFLEYILVFFILYTSLKKTSEKNIAIPNLYKQLSQYGLPVLLTGLGMTALITVDIILVKHFLPPLVAGQYAALSLMGRSIFYLILPILSVFFPLIAQKNAREEGLSGTILLAVLLISGISLPISAIYFIFPELVLNIFFPAKEYAALSPYMGIFSLFIVMYTFSWLIKSFFLSIGKTRVFIFTLIAAAIESLYITFFHESISQILYGMIGVSFFLLISLLLYYLLGSKKATQ